MPAVTFHYCPTSFNHIWHYNNEIGEHNHDLRNQNMYFRPHPRIELYKRSPLYQLPLCWNELDETKLHQNKTTFNISLKSKLIKELNSNNLQDIVMPYILRVGRRAGK